MWIAIYSFGMMTTMYLAHRFWMKQFQLSTLHTTRDEFDTILHIAFFCLVGLAWFITVPAYLLWRIFEMMDRLIESG